MIVNVYSTSLLKKIDYEGIRKSLPSMELDHKTCYTLREQDAFKHDQGKALQSVAISSIKRSKADIVFLENGVNEVTKISQSGCSLRVMNAMLRNRAAALVEFAESVLRTTGCQILALIEMMPRFDHRVSNEESKAFLRHAHNEWNKAVQDMITKNNSRVQTIRLIGERDVQLHSKERLFGNRDGLHFAGKDASKILANKLERGIRCLMLKLRWAKLDRNRATIHQDNHIASNSQSVDWSNVDDTHHVDWNDIIEEDIKFAQEMDNIKLNTNNRWVANISS